MILRRAALFFVMPLVTAACGPAVDVTPGDRGSSSSTTASSDEASSSNRGTTSSDMPGATAPEESTDTLDSTGPGRDVTSGSATSSDTQGGSSTGPAPIASCILESPDCPAGEKCMPWADDGGPIPNAARCSPIEDTPGAAGEVCQVDGEPFSGVDDCGDGLFCSEVDDTTGQGVCRHLCPGGEVCDDLETACIEWFDGALPICTRTCDALIPAACPSGNGCYSLPATGNCDFAACGHQVADGGQGDACSRLNDCGDGFQCVDGALVPDCGNERCCTRYCDLTEADSCSTLKGTSCETELDSGNCPPAFYDVGVCLVPA